MGADEERLGRAKEVFADALERPADERAALVDSACADDGELRGLVRDLLDAHQGAARFLDAPTLTPQAPGAGPGGGEAPGSRIGPYKLLEQIGEGGFGVVFMAEQTEPVVRWVALKIIKAGMDTRQVIARFEAERQALAMMDHPNIARVLDAGATETGRPYFVMELVRGDPITEYCDKNKLTTGERLALFTDVCHAVQHAHQKGIIHRDIKPSNVLVTMFDGRPAPKVIDFGIAKAMNQRLTDKTLFTAHRQLIGTPQYMSPEQAEMSGVDIDTRSDIYSLGVLLYELLTGTTPFDPEHLRSAALAEVQRIIREEEPPKPSTRLSELARNLGDVNAEDSRASALYTLTPRNLDATSAAASRRTDRAQLVRAIRGDLDWIVMKCLEKERSRRYDTADGLAMDVQRHIAGEPVVAAPVSNFYRFRKLACRHRAAVTTASLLSAALLIGFIGTATFAFRESVARADADRRGRETARVAEFQAKMLSRIDPATAGAELVRDLLQRQDEALMRVGVDSTERAMLSEAFSGELTRINGTDVAVAMLDRTILSPALRALDHEFADNPGVDVALRQSIGDIYVRLGLVESARPLLEQALATRRRSLGDDHPDTLASMHAMAMVLDRLGPPDQAQRLAREVIDRRRIALGEDHPDTLASEAGFASLVWRDSGPAEVLIRVREALEHSRRVLGEDHPTSLGAAERLSYLLLESRRFEEAEDLARQVLHGRQRTLAADDFALTTAAANLGVALQWQGKFAEAEPYLREAAERSRQVRGEDHWETIHGVNNLSIVLRDMGRLDEALGLRRDVLERRRRVLGPLHPNTLDAMSKVGLLLLELGRHVEAEAALREALDSRRRAAWQDEQATLWDATNLGSALTALDRFAEAETLLRDTLEAATQTQADSRIIPSRCQRSLGELMIELRRFSDAESFLRGAVPAYADQWGPDHWATLSTRIQLVRALVGQARFDQAERDLLQIDLGFSRSSGTTPERYRQCIEAFIDLYDAWEAAEPGNGYEARAREWRDRLATSAPGADGAR